MLSCIADPACAFRCKLLPLCVFVFPSPRAFLLLRRSVRCSLVNYSRLVMYSFGFQQAFQRGMCPEDEIFLTKVPIPDCWLERVFC